ncbi:MAG: hypothetical protein EA368_01895 [Leptolyngbya sp. DLM2.Bin27]|nr:MAG: hypothetical protein EA368_01895 [Leptolyngbya sp. DLM2.Bin27]
MGLITDQPINRELDAPLADELHQNNANGPGKENPGNQAGHRCASLILSAMKITWFYCSEA